ncbi:hypothetical protein CTI12_AA324310 [Artemisia annua]|uniref:Uncharacterized protein n=1 Tax=Artemisia annua TaxID=35608 RepID=A0A2U1MXL2_ARTAN|nr:hypothetical protein CTI12_AA324310 [Artemisia annua]
MAQKVSKEIGSFGEQNVLLPSGSPGTYYGSIKTDHIVAATLRFIVGIGYTTWKNMSVRLWVKTGFIVAGASRFLGVIGYNTRKNMPARLCVKTALVLSRSAIQIL